MDRKRLTLIVLSPRKGNIRQLRLRIGWVAAVIVVFAVSLGLGGFGLYSHLNARMDRKNLRELRREARTHRDQVQVIATDMDELRGRIARLQEMDKKIRIIANLQRSPTEVQTPGIGGVGSGEGLFLSLQQEPRGRWVKRIHEHVDYLRDLASQQEASFKALEGQLREKKELLASTPSIWPTQGWLTGGFGYRQSPFTGTREFHKGLDVAAKLGTPVIAPGDGMVLEVGTDKDFGEIMRLEHGFGFRTFYAHLSEVVVKKGQRVTRGQMIAKVGNTGRSTGPHLHYEMYVDGLPANPLRYIFD